MPCPFLDLDGVGSSVGQSRQFGVSQGVNCPLLVDVWPQTKVIARFCHFSFEVFTEPAVILGEWTAVVTVPLAVQQDPLNLLADG